MKDADAKKHLMSLKVKLQSQEAEFQEINRPIELDQTRLGRLSRMDALQVQQMELETSRRRQNQLLKIDGALNRLKMDEYGFCFVCGEELDERRLSTDPTITRCLKCTDS